MIQQIGNTHLKDKINDSLWPLNCMTKMPSKYIKPLLALNSINECNMNLSVIKHFMVQRCHLL